MYLRKDYNMLIDIYNNHHILLFIAIILSLGYFVVSILFSLDFYKKII